MVKSVGVGVEQASDSLYTPWWRQYLNGGVVIQVVTSADPDIKHRSPDTSRPSPINRALTLIQVYSRPVTLPTISTPSHLLIPRFPRTADTEIRSHIKLLAAVRPGIYIWFPSGRARKFPEYCKIGRRGELLAGVGLENIRVPSRWCTKSLEGSFLLLDRHRSQLDWLCRPFLYLSQLNLRKL